jgi:two-component system response regulator FlrC
MAIGERRLLIVEDESDLRATLSQLATQMGLFHETAVNGQEALEKLRKEPFTAILSDLSMPVMGGVELIEELRKSKNQIPVVILTALGDRELLRHALRLGVWDYVDKPFDVLQLQKILHNVLEAGERMRRIEQSDEGIDALPPHRRLQEKKMINLLRLANSLWKKSV